MEFILFPLAAIVVIALLCINVKIGFMVSDATENTGFNAGFYMITVIGLIAAEVSLIAYIAS